MRLVKSKGSAGILPRAMTGMVLATFANMLFATAAHAQDVPAEAPAAPPPPGYPPPPPGSPYGAPRYQLQRPMAGPFVQMTSDSPNARLQIMQFKWRDVCRAPCQVPVDPNGLYRIGGGTVRPSEEFRMPRPAGTVQIDTQAGSTVKHWVGFGMVIGGIAGLALGGLLLAASSDTHPDAYGNDPGDGLKALGIGYLIVGGIVTAIGIPLAASTTTVEIR